MNLSLTGFITVFITTKHVLLPILLQFGSLKGLMSFGTDNFYHFFPSASFSLQ